MASIPSDEPASKASFADLTDIDLRRSDDTVFSPEHEFVLIGVNRPKSAEHVNLLT